MIVLRLTPQEARALAHAVELARDVLATAGCRVVIDGIPVAAGETALEQGHLRLLAALERQEVAA